MLYSELDLHEDLKKNIAQLGFETATPIQELVMPHAIDGKDISGLAQTGTGKTAAFLIPLIQRILVSKENREDEKFAKQKFKNWSESSFVLCLVPTRELAIQVAGQASKLAGSKDISVVSAVGGEDIEEQIRQIKKRPLDILIATPGRMIDLYKSHHIDLKQVVAVVFDEADRMFDMGFKDDMKYILRRLPDDRQYLLFSATMNLDVLTISYQFGAEPVECHLRSEKLKADNVEDEIFHVAQSDKARFLLSILQREKPNQVIIFTNLKRLVQPLADFLQKNSFDALGISSLLNQKQRNRVLEHFKTPGKANILVATDVAARGLDVEGVDLVINYDLPDDAENYVHRIGRTGRAGKKGKAFSLSSDRDVEALTRIQEYIGNKITIGWLDDEDLVKDFKPLETHSRPEFLSERKKAFERKKRDGRDSRAPKGRGSHTRDRNAAGDSPRKESGQESYSSAKRRGARPSKTSVDHAGAKPRSAKQYKPVLKNSSEKVTSKNTKTNRPQAPSQKARVSKAKEAGVVAKIQKVFRKLFS